MSIDQAIAELKQLELENYLRRLDKTRHKLRHLLESLDDGDIDTDVFVRMVRCVANKEL